MFDKLKRKFILINMTLLTTTFILIFGSVYIFTYQSNERELGRNLKNAINGPRKLGPESPFMAASIIVEIDSKNSIANIFSLLDFEEEEIEETVVKIINSEVSSGKIKIGENSYGYLKEINNKGLKIALLDRQQQINVLNDLLTIFIYVGMISLFVLYLISVYLTNKTIKPLKESFEKQKQFITDASHELKTPLAIIRTNSSVILANKDESVESQRKWLHYINDQTDRMSKLIEEMLTLAKIDDVKEIAEIEKFDLSNLINNILLTFEAYIFENNITLESYIKEGILIKGDKENIKKAVIIILDNAIKYTNNKGKISISLIEDKNKIKISIKNTGDGIKKEYLDKIFERFYRVDESRVRGTGGYGLGLSIAKSIIDFHKGKIYAESDLGKDTTFNIELNKENLERLGDINGR